MWRALHSEKIAIIGQICDGKGNNVEIAKDEAVGILSRNATLKYGNEF